VRWSIDGSPNGKWESRVFRLRRAAIEWLVLLDREGREAELYVAPSPTEWTRTAPGWTEVDAVERAVDRRLARRRTARERWAEA
jgi:hypothetical protein